MKYVLVSVIFESSNSERLFHTGYRPALRFEGSDEYNSGMLKFIDCKTVRADKSIQAHLTMLAFERVRALIKPGVTFALHESPALRVGHGHVLALRNE